MRNRSEGARDEKASSVGDVVGSAIERAAGTSSSMVVKAGVAWNKAISSREQKHTCGVYLVDEPNKPKVLVVYIDSNVMMQDFTTNREVYLVKLAHVGLKVDDVQFRLSKREYAPQVEKKVEARHKVRVKDLPEEDQEQVDTLTKEVGSAAVRHSLREAMISSLKLENAKNTKKHKMSR